MLFYRVLWYWWPIRSESAEALIIIGNVFGCSHGFLVSYVFSSINPGCRFSSGLLDPAIWSRIFCSLVDLYMIPEILHVFIG